MKTKLFVFCLLPVLIFAQKSIDITGRVSVNTLNIDYDENSDIKPDSVNSKEYSKTTLIPGIQQTLNMAIFARTTDLDISLLGDIRNDEWNRFDFNSHKSVDRLSLGIRFSDHEIVLGDFYESGSEFFLQSREIRGGKLNFVFNNVWNNKSFLELKTIFGLSQKAYRQGAKLQGLYKQYESSGQFRRSLASASVKVGESGFYKVGLHYLFAEDNKNSIDKSLNDALNNQNIGFDGSVSLWENNIMLFGEGYFSNKDTLDFGKSDDHSFKAGTDFRYDQFKLIVFYQRLGFNYYSAGYPFLLNDRQGFRVQSAYNFPKVMLLSLDGEQYENNLENDSKVPTTTTRIGEVSVTSGIKQLPALTLLFGFRDDISKSVFNEQDEKTKTDKISRKYEARISQDFYLNRFSLSTIYLDLDDNSKIAGGAPLGTEQFIGSLNFYTRPSNTFFISGGAVYSRLLLTDSKDSKNYFFYQSSRWDIVPQVLIFESTINAVLNDAKNSGNDDLLNNYWQLDGRISLEYFFNENISLKLIGGTNSRQMDYSTQEALKILQSPDVDPTFFSSNESYNALIYGAEINWMF